VSDKREVPGIHPYTNPAGGWGALRATARAVREEMDFTEAAPLFLRMNKPNGFDCPGCAWPDKNHTSTFQFCENGAKAVTWEATNKRVQNRRIKMELGYAFKYPNFRQGYTAEILRLERAGLLDVQLEKR